MSLFFWILVAFTLRCMGSARLLRTSSPPLGQIQEEQRLSYEAGEGSAR